jgi:hypothetical protein
LCFLEENDYMYIDDSITIDQFLTSYCGKTLEQQWLVDVPHVWYGYYVTPTQPALVALDQIIIEQFPTYSNLRDR